MANIRYSAPLAAVICTALLFSCAPDIEPPPPPPQSTNFCVYPQTQQCFSTSQTTCAAGGELSDFCPYGNSVATSSSSRPASSNSVAVSSSSRPSSSSVVLSLSSSATQQWVGGPAELDIVIRDFSAPANSLRERQAAGYNGYYGFQEFDYDKPNQRPAQTRECNPNGASKGMVQKKLDYSECSADEKKGTTDIEKAANGRYCARPVPATSPAPDKACYGEHLDSWYTNGSQVKVINEILTLTCRNGLCGVDTVGYFPLDKYSDTETWGKQNSDGRTQHNFGFTVAGSAEFRFVAANKDNFAFRGDDDMWVFIDGELVIDLGGVHQKLSDSIAINDIANDRKWKDSSMHSINFFYAERQTSESNLRLTFRLTDLSPPRFGAPYIKRAETTMNEDGTSVTLIWVSNKLDTATINKFIGSNEFPIIIKQTDKKDSVNGYKLASISLNGLDGSNGYLYTITGSVCKSRTDDCKLVIGSGDSLSFNVKSGDLQDAGYSNRNGIALTNESWYIKSESLIEATKVTWAPNTTQMPPIVFKPIPGDDDPTKPPFDVDIWFGNAVDEGCIQCGQLPSKGIFPGVNTIWDPETKQMVPVSQTNTIVHSFGQKGTAIPPQRAGELVLTALPNASGTVNTINGQMPYAEWRENEDLQKIFGLPPEVSDYGPYGIADPKKQATDGGYQFVKNGFPNESSVSADGRIAPTRCIADRNDPKKPKINCLNFSLPARQPFQLSVILYDQLGNFVTQYREVVSEQDFRSVVQGPNYVAEEQTNVNKLKGVNSECKAPTSSNYGAEDVLTLNGEIKVNVNIYPFSKDGRRFGNGVYIAKIDRVDLPYKGCVNNNGTPMKIEADYKRYHTEQKFGWMRSK